MEIHELASIPHEFLRKPLLFGGKALEFYGLRSADDVDFLVADEDYRRLAQLYPAQRKSLGPDIGISLDKLEFWASFYGYGYDVLVVDACEREGFCIISLERLLFLKALTIETAKGERDTRLIARQLREMRYGTI